LHFSAGSFSRHKQLLKGVIDGHLTEDMTMNTDLISHLECLATEELDSLTTKTMDTSSQSANDLAIGSTQINVDEGKAAAPEIAIPVGDEWQLLQSLQGMQYKQAETQRLEMQRLKRLKFKEALDQQIMIAKELKAKQELDSVQYNVFVERDVKQHREEEFRKAQMAKKKSEEELLIRRKQMEEAKAKKKRDLETERENAQLLIKKALDNLDTEKHKAEEIKRKMLETHQALGKHNEEDKERRAFAKSKEQEEDNRLMQEYSDKIEREELERQARLKKRLEGADLSCARYASNLLAQAVDKKRQEEMLFLVETQRKEAAEAAAELAKEAERRRRIEQDHAENERIREWHRMCEANDAREKELLKEKYRQELENNKAKLDDSKRKKVFLQNQYRNALLAQMKGPLRGPNSSMDGHERDINLSLLKQAVEELPVYKLPSPTQK
jgi:hypothetical protein